MRIRSATLFLTSFCLVTQIFFFQRSLATPQAASQEQVLIFSFFLEAHCSDELCLSTLSREYYPEDNSEALQYCRICITAVCKNDGTRADFHQMRKFMKFDQNSANLPNRSMLHRSSSVCYIVMYIQGISDALASSVSSFYYKKTRNRP